LVNDCWEKNPLTNDELHAIKPLLERIWTLKHQGLTGFGITASYMRCRVQLLKEREHLGFECSRAKDPSRMVPALELTEEEVLERLRKVMKGLTIVSHAVPEYCGDNPPLL
jgi:chorismate mutase